MRKIVVLLMLLLVPSFSYADWTAPRDITLVIIEGPDDGSVAFVGFGDQFNPANCNGALSFNQIDLSTAKGRNMLSLILSAKARGKAIKTDIDNANCSTWRNLNRPIINGVWEP